jgi:hypothetical protein
MSSWKLSLEDVIMDYAEVEFASQVYIVAELEATLTQYDVTVPAWWQQ